VTRQTYIRTMVATYAAAERASGRRQTSQDCDCTDEIQFWSHGSPGNDGWISGSKNEITATIETSPAAKNGKANSPRSNAG
jgi:hypothetical protein